MRSKSSHRWLKEHFTDEYVKRAQSEGYRSRAAYKLLEIQEKDAILKPGMTVIDLGAAPGSWTQVVAQVIGKQGKIFALDLLPMEAIENVEFIQGDFQEQAILDTLLEAVKEQGINVVLSDMAPNTSGIKSADQTKSMYLAELALDFATQVLNQGGSFLVKIFQGPGFDDFWRQLKTVFSIVVIRKPKASRARSKEVYVLAKGFK